MRVLFIPDFTDGNPYQRELATAVEQYGNSVLFQSASGMFFDTIDFRRGPDVLHLHWLHSLLIGQTPFGAFRSLTVLKGIWLLVQLLWAKLQGIAVVWTVHNVLEHERRHPYIERAFKHIIFRLCDRVIFHCRDEVETAISVFELSDHFRENARVIPHGHYIESYSHDQSSQPAQPVLPLTDERTVFLYFGLIREYKNIPTLLETFQDLPYEEVQLLVVGKPMETRLDSDITALSSSDPRIRSVLRFVPDEEVPQYFDAADVVILPFSRVSMSGSAMLAMSFGKPVITPDTGCLSEYLDETNGELLYDPADSEGLYDAIEQALNADLDTIGRRNYRRAQQFDWNRIGRLTHETYVEALL